MSHITTSPKTDATPSVVFKTADTPFQVITDRPMPDLGTPRRSIYPFDSMAVGTCFLAGKGDKGLTGRLYTAIHTRRKKHPTERYDFERMDNGDLYVWRVA